MPSNQSAVSSQGFGEILDAIEARLVGASGYPAHKVRSIVAGPDEDLSAEYLGEPGITIRVFPPDPDPMAGAGRHGTPVQRRVEIFVTTENLRDPGGRAGKAIRQHFLAEEAVVDCLHLDPPTGHGASIPVAKIIKWVPGGRDVARRLQKNAALVTSSMAFVITYLAKVTVYRGP